MLMPEMFSWVKSEWFSLVQTVGVIGGLVFTGITIRQAGKAWIVQSLPAFAEKHRTLWTEIAERPELHRIIAKSANLAVNPITPAEEIALNIVLVHFETGWRLAESLDKEDLDALAKDVGKFFARPLVQAAWLQTKDCHNARFVKFVSRALEAAGRLQ